VVQSDLTDPLSPSMDRAQLAKGGKLATTLGATDSWPQGSGALEQPNRPKKAKPKART
jgi:hypothetical protein